MVTVEGEGGDQMELRIILIYLCTIQMALNFFSSYGVGFRIAENALNSKL